MTDWTKWRMAPVEATDEMIAAAEKNAEDEGFAMSHLLYAAMLAAAPAPPVVEVTTEAAVQVTYTFYGSTKINRPATAGRRMIAAVQSVLGPTLGLVTREQADAEIAALRADSARLNWLLHWLADPANCRNIRFDRAMIDEELEAEGGGNG